jgi:hypothetical protein
LRLSVFSVRTGELIVSCTFQSADFPIGPGTTKVLLPCIVITVLLLRRRDSGTPDILPETVEKGDVAVCKAIIPRTEIKKQ